MIKVDLLKKYPDLIDKCREWNCSYQEAISRLKNKKELQTTLDDTFDEEGGLIYV